MYCTVESIFFIIHAQHTRYADTRFTKVAISKEDTVLEIPPSHPADKSREPCKGSVGSSRNVPPSPAPVHIVPEPFIPFWETLQSTFS